MLRISRYLLFLFCLLFECSRSNNWFSFQKVGDVFCRRSIKRRSHCNLLRNCSGNSSQPAKGQKESIGIGVRETGGCECVDNSRRICCIFHPLTATRKNQSQCKIWNTKRMGVSVLVSKRCFGHACTLSITTITLLMDSIGDGPV